MSNVDPDLLGPVRSHLGSGAARDCTRHSECFGCHRTPRRGQLLLSFPFLSPFRHPLLNPLLLLCVIVRRLLRLVVRRVLALRHQVLVCQQLYSSYALKVAGLRAPTANTPSSSSPFKFNWLPKFSQQSSEALEKILWPNNLNSVPRRRFETRSSIVALARIAGLFSRWQSSALWLPFPLLLTRMVIAGIHGHGAGGVVGGNAASVAASGWRHPDERQSLPKQTYH